MKHILHSTLTLAIVFMVIVAAGCSSCRRDGATQTREGADAGQTAWQSSKGTSSTTIASEPPVLLGDAEIVVGKGERKLIGQKLGQTSARTYKTQDNAFWVVEKFTEKKTWLKSQPSIEKLNRQWGNKLAQAVRKALMKRSLTVESVSKKLTEKQIEQLASEGMKYLCGGSLEGLAQTEDQGKKLAALSVVYELKRSAGKKTRLVQKERLSFSIGIAGETISEADLQALVETAANAIAGRIVEHIPSDLAASRG